MYQHTSKAPVMSMSLPIKKLKLPWDCKAPIFILPCFGHSQMVVPEAKWRFNVEPPKAGITPYAKAPSKLDKSSLLNLSRASCYCPYFLEQ